MTSITFPEELPATLRLNGLSGKPKGNVIRTEMDAGPAKQRQRYSVSTKEFSGSLVLNSSQRQIFEEWYENTLGSGALRFKMKDPQTLREEEFRFTDDYNENCDENGMWTIVMPLERMNAKRTS